MSTQLYWVCVAYLVGMVVMACSSYNFMHRRAPTYEIEINFPVKLLFLGGALFFGSTWPVWMTISIVNFIKRRKHESSSS